MQYQFESMLKFIEWRFNIPPLTNRDLHASNLLNAFDFQKPLNPSHIVPLTAGEFAAIRPHINLARTINYLCKGLLELWLPTPRFKLSLVTFFRKIDWIFLIVTVNK